MKNTIVEIYIVKEAQPPALFGNSVAGLSSILQKRVGCHTV